MNAIELKNLSKQYKDFCLNNINLEIPKGTIMGIIGENGAGKSTIINLLLNLTKKTSGTITILGKEMEPNEKEIKADLGVIYDECCYHPKFTCKDVEHMMEKVYKTWDHELYMNYIKQFELPMDRAVEKMSRGMKMKLCFAATLAHKPKLLILDEATSGLDPMMRNDILNLLQDYIEDGENTVLMTSHITSDLDKIADYITYIHKGELLFTKTFEQIHEEYGILHCGKDTFDSLCEDDIVAYIKEPYEWKVLVEHPQEIRKIHQDLMIDRPSIEDIMLFYTKGVK